MLRSLLLGNKSVGELSSSSNIDNNKKYIIYFNGFNNHVYIGFLWSPPIFVSIFNRAKNIYLSSLLVIKKIHKITLNVFWRGGRGGGGGGGVLLNFYVAALIYLLALWRSIFSFSFGPNIAEVKYYVSSSVCHESVTKFVHPLATIVAIPLPI